MIGYVLSILMIFTLCNSLGATSPNLNNNFSFLVERSHKSTWGSGQSLLGFLAKNNIPQSLYYNLALEDKELVSDIYAGATFYIIKDEKDRLTNVYIPISEFTQIRIYLENNEYKMELEPILSIKVAQKLAIQVETSPYEDIIRQTGDYALANEFTTAYKNTLDFKRSVKRGDTISIFYNRKYRLGRYIGAIDIVSANMQVKNKDNYLFGYQNRYYDIHGREITSFLLITPLNYRRISSKFSYGRKHPVLGIVRPHYGVDFAAPVGTVIRAAANGKIIFSGSKGGYGKVVIIAHSDGIKTLYAHMSRFSKISRINNYVKQSTVIGYVGSTGMSTGPHLHFGVYKNNKPIDPLGRIKTARTELKGNEKKEYTMMAMDLKNKINSFIENNNEALKSKKYVLQTEIIK